MKVISELVSGTTTKHKIFADGRYQSFYYWIDQMQNSIDFIRTFNRSLIESQFEAFFWEVKPIDKKSIDQDFEFVIVNSDSLSRIEQNDSSFKA